MTKHAVSYSNSTIPHERRGEDKWQRTRSYHIPRTTWAARSLLKGSRPGGLTRGVEKRKDYKHEGFYLNSSKTNTLQVALTTYNYLSDKAQPDISV